jgi:hypothetical protein
LGRGSDLESRFAFGVVRQLFERRLAGASAVDCETLLAGPAQVLRTLLFGETSEMLARDTTSFAVLPGLYWLTVNLATRRSLVILIDEAHLADEPSQRWLAYLATRLEGLPLTLLIHQAGHRGPRSTPRRARRRKNQGSHRVAKAPSPRHREVVTSPDRMEGL